MNDPIRNAPITGRPTASVPMPCGSRWSLAGRAARAVPVMAALLAVGCTGDVDPLEEAVEVSVLGLDSLSIEQPADTRSPLTINPGERLQFTLDGLNANGGEVEVSGAGRRWRVLDPNIASIDGNGELVGLADGTTAIDVRIGDVAAGQVDVTVSRSSLGSILEIVGEEAVDPCVAERYVAIGGFADGSERLLRDVDWSVTAVGAEILQADDGSATLAARRPNMIDLVAAVGERSLAQPILVRDSLRSLTISPELSSLTAEVGSTLDLVAVGAYDDTDDGSDEEGNRQETVTDGVEWRVVSDSGVAAFIDDPATRGRVRGDADGIATVRAICGDTRSEDRQFVVRSSTSSDGDASDDGELAFFRATNAQGDGDGGTLRVDGSRGFVELFVSTGSSYDENADVTSRAEWELVDDGDDGFGPIATIDDDGVDRGRLTFSGTGRVQVRATLGSRSSTLTVIID